MPKATNEFSGRFSGFPSQERASNEHPFASCSILPIWETFIEKNYDSYYFCVLQLLYNQNEYHWYSVGMQLQYLGLR